MENRPLEIVIIGLSITSSWGNGHATTYRGLVRELDRIGHHVLFLERDAPWYAQNRDLPDPPWCKLGLYHSTEELKEKFTRPIKKADFVITGSYVPEGVAVGNWVNRTAGGATAFYDIDTPVTLARLARGDCGYLSPQLIPEYDLYLSFTGGPILDYIERKYCSPAARPLYCSVDPSFYFPEETDFEWDLGYLGTYSADRQPSVGELLISPAKKWEQGRFIVAGPMYPKSLWWPANVKRVDHLPARSHRRFYNGQRFTLNLTRKDMIAHGYSPSIRLFEAAACGTPVISDFWEGLDSFFKPGEDILVARTSNEVLKYLTSLPEPDRREIGRNAMNRVLEKHTARHRVNELLEYMNEIKAIST